MNYSFIGDFNKILSNRNLTIAFAESITAGLIASSIAGVSGASSILKGSVVTYEGSVKNQILKVQEETLSRCSAESKETTEEMVKGLESLLPGADIYVAITGVASKPGTDYKVKSKVGDVFLSIKYKGEIENFYSRFYGGRNEIREQAVYMALNKVLKVIGSLEE